MKKQHVNTFLGTIENDGIGYAIENYWGRDIPADDENVTHWMSLPENPKQK